MSMRNSLSFAGTDLAEEFGVYINGDGTFSAPQRSYTYITVPGRNGQLVMDNGRYENLTVSYRCFMKSNFDTNMRRLRNFLLYQTGYQKLRDSYHSDEFRLGVFAGPFDPAVNANLKSGEFTLSFNCKPQRFTDDGLYPVNFSESGYLQNPWRGTAKPLIHIYGTGRVVINGYPIVINSNDSLTTVDCETMECREGSTSRNSDTVLANGYPELTFGSNRIFIQTGADTDLISLVTIVPRWWRL